MDGDYDITYSIPYMKEKDEFSSIAASDSDSSTLVDLKRKVKELERMLHEIEPKKGDDSDAENGNDNRNKSEDDGDYDYDYDYDDDDDDDDDDGGFADTNGDDDDDLDNEQLLANTDISESKTPVSELFSDANIDNMSSDFSERTNKREHSEQLLRQELSAVDMVHELSGLYWKKYYEETLKLPTEGIVDPVFRARTRNNNDSTSTDNNFGMGDDDGDDDVIVISFSDSDDVEQPLQCNATTKLSSALDITSGKSAITSGRRRRTLTVNRKIFIATIFCTVMTMITLVALILILLNLDTIMRVDDTSAIYAGDDHTSPNEIFTLLPAPAPSSPPVVDTTAAPVQGEISTPLPSQRENPSVPSGSSSTDTPSQVPNTTNFPTDPPIAHDLEVRNALIQYLETTHGVVFGTAASPAHRAVDWLLEEKRPIILNEKLAQRFALVALDYGLSQPTNADESQRNWWRTLSFSSTSTSPLSWIAQNQDSCNWDGVKCNANELVEELSFGGRNLTGTITNEISILSTLKVLDLSHNKICGTIPSKVYTLPNINELFLYHNQLSGKLSLNFGEMVHATRIHLSHNQITGTIPNTVKKLNSLRYLNLYRNSLSGTMPSYFRVLSNLQYLDLGHNNLTGTLPSSLPDYMYELKFLNVDHNSLTKTIPPSYALRLHSLQSLTLEYNNLTGSIPIKNSSPASTYLVELTLHENDFSKKLDDDTCEMNIFELGQVIEFNADCTICSCPIDKDNYFCQHCFQ